MDEVTNSEQPTEQTPAVPQPSTTSQNLKKPFFSKHFWVVLIVGIVILGLGIGGFYWYLNSQNKQSAQIAVTKSQQLAASLTPAVNPSSIKEINNFPVYPQAEFVQKDIQDPCPTDGAGGFSFCGMTQYKWKSPDLVSKIINWYTSDKSNSGWKCTGEAGEGDIHSPAIITNCSKNNLTYKLLVSRNAVSFITLGIPNSSQSADTSSWKTYTDTDGNYSINYPVDGIVTRKTQTGFIASKIFGPPDFKPLSVIEIQSPRNNSDNLTNYYDITITSEHFEPNTAQYAIQPAAEKLLNHIKSYSHGTVDGFTGDWKSSDAGSFDASFIARGNSQYYLIEVTGDNGETTAASTSIFNKVLSSFKFTK